MKKRIYELIAIVLLSVAVQALTAYLIYRRQGTDLTQGGYTEGYNRGYLAGASEARKDRN